MTWQLITVEDGSIETCQHATELEAWEHKFTDRRTVVFSASPRQNRRRPSLAPALGLCPICSDMVLDMQTARTLALLGHLVRATGTGRKIEGHTSEAAAQTT